jgi:uncharacterized membrane protein
MNKTRLEAFSDGVLAIIITIMVLELKVPHESTFEALKTLLPVFSSYILSFVLIGIYWGNHHHLLHTVSQVTSSMIWANLHLLFWLSLIPFATAWMGENNFGKYSVICYSVLLILCAIAYTILQSTVMKNHIVTEKLEKALKKQEKKGYISLTAYTLAAIFAFINPGISAALFVAVAVLWIIPDKNIEDALKK